MFENLLNSKTPNLKYFETEKELILYMIDKCYGFSSSSKHSIIYDAYAPKEWKNDSQYFSLEYSRGISFYARDSVKCQYLARHCDDKDILRSLFESDKLPDDREIMYGLVNVNLPDDIIIRLCEKYYLVLEVLEGMQKVEYKYITEETKAKIAATIVECKEKIREEKEDETKKKLTAFLTTAAATKSVLTGNSIDDVVEQTVTSDVDDAVLDYMNTLFDKK